MSAPASSSERMWARPAQSVWCVRAASSVAAERSPGPSSAAASAPKAAMPSNWNTIGMFQP